MVITQLTPAGPPCTSQVFAAKTTDSLDEFVAMKLAYFFFFVEAIHRFFLVLLWRAPWTARATAALSSALISMDVA